MPSASLVPQHGIEDAVQPSGTHSYLNPSMTGTSLSHDVMAYDVIAYNIMTWVAGCTQLRPSNKV